MDARAEFERAVKRKWSDSYIFNLESSDRYVDEILEAMFWAWQASRHVLEGEPVMWSLQFENGPVNHFTTYPTLEKAEDYVTLCNIGKEKTNIKIIPLYKHPSSADVPFAEYIRALQDAFDIIQSDANTEQNYGSLCLIGGVLAKLKAGQGQSQ